jgi:hypothetical protein
MERLSTLDASFLYMEAPRHRCTSLTWGSAPLYQINVSLMDPNRIIDGCRNRIQLARELRILAARSHMILLDRSRPLWQLE